MAVPKVKAQLAFKSHSAVERERWPPRLTCLILLFFVGLVIFLITRFLGLFLCFLLLLFFTYADLRLESASFAQSFEAT